MTGFVFAQCNPMPPVTTFVTTGGNGQKGTIRGTIGDV
jgi:hypothetical protein